MKLKKVLTLSLGLTILSSTAVFAAGKYGEDPNFSGYRLGYSIDCNKIGSSSWSGLAKTNYHDPIDRPVYAYIEYVDSNGSSLGTGLASYGYGYVTVTKNSTNRNTAYANSSHSAKNSSGNSSGNYWLQISAN